MSLHKSLVSRSRLRRHRNVLTRAERIEKLSEEDRWDEEQSVFGLPKVKNIKHVRASKKKEDKAAAAEAAEASETEEAPETKDES